jgi:beta-glucosidase
VVDVRQPVSDVIATARRLVGFTRVDLASGASPVEHVSFPVSKLAVTPADIESTKRPAVEPGAYQVQVGSQTANFSITG